MNHGFDVVGTIIFSFLVFIFGFACGVFIPYVYNLVAMVLRHCGGL